ncbi:hypothetical protein LJC15_04365 [Desulfovibrio sp. OttesenSCG-928-G11]|nr:hypothetical protein [Desulfovibrio sp. OttesenSCG-928-G11]
MAVQELMERDMLDYYRFKSVSELFRQGKEEEAMLELAQLQRRYVALCDENTTLKLQAQEYEDILYLSRNLSFDGEFYWLTTGSVRQGPFCPHCYNKDGLLMRLSGEAGERFCSTCRERFPNSGKEQTAMAMAAPGFDEALFLPAMEISSRRAKVIPFGKQRQ